jgi:hypothetical protein
MTIEIEYSPGDIAWVMNDNRIAKVRIKRVDISITEVPDSLSTPAKVAIIYYADNRPLYYSATEIFKSKEDVIQSLQIH